MSSAGPLVSVLLPFRNAAPTLPAAVRSILRQSYRRLELIAVDDGSTDQGGEWLRARARRDARVRVLEQPATGLCAALQRGLASCQGELIARMDADDISLQGRLQAQVAHLGAHPDQAAAGTRFRLVPRTELSDGMLHYESWSNGLLEPEQIRRDLFVESPLCHPTVMLRAAVLQELGGYGEDAQRWPEDYDLWLRLDQAGHRLGKLGAIFLLWRESPGRLSRWGAAYRSERFAALKQAHLLQRLQGRRILIWGAGREGKPWLQRLGALGLLEDRVIDVDPRKLGQRIHGCRVIPPAHLGPPEPDRLLLVAVGSRGARQQIRAHLDGAGYREPEHYICVA